MHHRSYQTSLAHSSQKNQFPFSDFGKNASQVRGSGPLNNMLFYTNFIENTEKPKIVRNSKWKMKMTYCCFEFRYL